MSMLQLVYTVYTKNVGKHAQADYNSYTIEDSGQLIAAFLPLSVCTVGCCFTIDCLQLIFVHFFISSTYLILLKTFKALNGL